MTNKDMAKLIALGLIETGIEGGYGSVSCSTAGDYPSMGCSQWEGLDGGRGDVLLSYTDGGDHFINRTYSDIAESDELETLSELLESEQGQEAQRHILAEDCIDYVDELINAGLTNPQCVIYAGMWCPTSTSVVSNFVRRRADRGYDINDLQTLHDLFYDEYAIAADVGEEYEEGYQNRADNIYDYVINLGLE